MKPVPTQPRLLLAQASVKTLDLLLVPRTEQPITTVAVRPNVLPDRPVPTEHARTPVPTQPRLLLAQASVKTLDLLLVPRTERPITTVAVRPSVLQVILAKMEPAKKIMFTTIPAPADISLQLAKLITSKAGQQLKYALAAQLREPAISVKIPVTATAVRLMPVAHLQTENRNVPAVLVITLNLQVVYVPAGLIPNISIAMEVPLF